MKWRNFEFDFDDVLFAVFCVVAIGCIVYALITSNIGTRSLRGSGLLLYTDPVTGCQYLNTGRGNLTPRMDKEGKQICSTEGK